MWMTPPCGKYVTHQILANSNKQLIQWCNGLQTIKCSLMRKKQKRCWYLLNYHPSQKLATLVLCTLLASNILVDSRFRAKVCSHHFCMFHVIIVIIIILTSSNFFLIEGWRFWTYGKAHRWRGNTILDEPGTLCRVCAPRHSPLR